MERIACDDLQAISSPFPNNFLMISEKSNIHTNTPI